MLQIDCARLKLCGRWTRGIDRDKKAATTTQEQRNEKFRNIRSTRAIIDKVHADTVRASLLPDVIERMKALGADLHTNTPEEFAAYVERDFARVGKAVKAANLRLD